MDDRCKQVRRSTILLSRANGGYHYGGCLSPVEILVELFDNHLSPQDDFILSKGHACWPFYVLLQEKGLTPKLQGHPSRDPANGIKCSTGSLGHGLPMGIGMALANLRMENPGQVYVLMGDGECQEGTTWESILIAGAQKLHNLIVFVDWNECQGSGRVPDILDIGVLPFTARNAGWDVWDLDGHNRSSIARAITEKTEKPKLIIARTVKGKGVPFMEDKPEWHARWLDGDELTQAVEGLS